jgi:lipoyl(octanoyl) transferase
VESRRTATGGTNEATHLFEWVWLGLVPYAKALRLQETIREQVAEGRAAETLLLLEHSPVITLGRNANPANVLASPERLARDGIEVVRTSRGGDVTFHGPGQLVGYPVFRLRRGIRAHVMAMANGIAAVLAGLGIATEWRDSRPGLWVGENKICAFGVDARQRIAMHGFALNVSIDLDGFRMIVPCGLLGAGVTSIAKLMGSPPVMDVVAADVALAFAQSFAMRVVRIPAAASRLQSANEDL